MIAKATNFVLFQATWLACVLGAAGGRPWIGPLAAGVFLVVHLLMSKRPLAELCFLIPATLLGTALDSIVGLTAVLNFAADPPPQWLCPLWITALWLAFATTLGSSLAWLQNRPVVAGVFGLIGGPLAYLAGVRLGAVTFGIPTPNALIWIGLEWAAAMVILSLLAPRILVPRRRPAETAALAVEPS